MIVRPTSPHVASIVPTVRVSELLERISSIGITYPTRSKKGWTKHSKFRDILRYVRYAKIVFEKSDVDLLEAATYKNKLWFYRLFSLICRERRNQVEQKFRALLKYAGKLLGHESRKKCGYKTPVIVVIFRKNLHFSENESEDHLISNLKNMLASFLYVAYEGKNYEADRII